MVACFTHWWHENWASIKNTELQNKKPRLRYNPLKNIVLLGCCWSVSLQFNLSLGKNAKIVSGNITLKNIASIYIDRKHVWEGKNLLVLETRRNCLVKNNEVNPTWQIKTMKVKEAFYKGFRRKFGVFFFVVEIF